MVKDARRLRRRRARVIAAAPRAAEIAPVARLAVVLVAPAQRVAVVPAAAVLAAAAEAVAAAEVLAVVRRPNAII